MYRIPLLAYFMFLVSCSSVIRTHGDADAVQLFFLGQSGSSRHVQTLESSCQFLGEVIGSEGHWYSYWFISNTLMVQNAINDLKNSVYAKGGNVAAVYGDMAFTTSVTLLGQAYKCNPAENNEKARF
jgi:hypothetical protein